MEVNSLLIFAAALIMSVGSPGPSIAALVSRVLAKGWRDVLPFLAAMWIGEIVWLTVAVIGLAALAETYYVAFVVLKWCGVAYLLWLAYQMWNSPPVFETTDDKGWKKNSAADKCTEQKGADESTQQEVTGRNALRMFGAGLLITAGNPKIMIFYVALLPTLLDMKAISVGDWASLVIITIVVIGTIDTSYVVLAHNVRKVFTQSNRIKWVNRSCAGIMASAAAFIAIRS